MGVEQLPASTVIVGGQLTLSGWTLPANQYDFEEDAEDRKNPAGRWRCKLTYSRRQTLQVTLEADHGTTVTTYTAGGTIASGVFTLADGSTASAWIIRKAPLSRTRGVTTVELDLIQQGDMIPA